MNSKDPNSPTRDKGLFRRLNLDCKRKRNRSKRLRFHHQSTDVDNIALSLMILSRSCDNCPSASSTTDTAATNNDNNTIESSPPPMTTALLAQNLSHEHRISHHINPILATPITMIPSNATFTASNNENMEFSPPPIAVFPVTRNILYKCNLCEKSFSSYQALGGHKTRHRKSSPSTTAVNNPSTSNSTASNISVLSRPHECSTCHKIFLTGQALGGHMRLHYKGVICGGKKSNVGASDQSHCSKIVRDFDLNMPAFECPEDAHEVLDDQPLECDEDVNEVLNDQALGSDENIDLNYWSFLNGFHVFL
ncbi:zinc finger ZAT10-like [Olea europaea subsp. europaea]|uniref:Zinc finger ZAT10-like n=1 Tax=Olea europaea subsp. europaea TaxID=158383 RepID=A0A8S0Q1P0_OLEEU|nr:zinc finger ZAT10-like [Olea europaea subsp. europaea]